MLNQLYLKMIHHKCILTETEPIISVKPPAILGGAGVRTKSVSQYFYQYLVINRGIFLGLLHAGMYSKIPFNMNKDV